MTVKVRIIAALLAAFMLVLASCSLLDIPDFNSCDPVFVDHFSNEDDIGSKHVSKLTAYYKAPYYYYTVTYTQDGHDFVYELLYIFSYGQQDMFFSIKKPEDCYTYFPKYYSDFLDAQATGAKKEYTEREIQRMIDDFYGRPVTGKQ